MTDRIDTVYTKNKTELLWSIEPGLVYAKIETKLLGTIWLGVVYYEN